VSEIKDAKMIFSKLTEHNKGIYSYKADWATPLWYEFKDN
jgi:hypothetical protein